MIKRSVETITNTNTDFFLLQINVYYENDNVGAWKAMKCRATIKSKVNTDVQISHCVSSMKSFFIAKLRTEWI